MNSINSSLGRVNSLSAEVDSALSGDNAAQAAEKYIAGVSAELGNIKNGLDQWQIVIDSSNNPAEAQELGKELSQYVMSLASGINGLNTSLGTSVASPVAKKMDSNVAQVQEFLGVAKSGNIDRETVAKLQSVEQDFNRRSGDTRWTGALVDSGGRGIIDYNKLRKAYELIQKY